MTPETDHDLLTRIDARMEELSKGVEAFNRESHEDRRQLWKEKADKAAVLDHELRLRRNERMIYIGLGGLMTIQIIFAMLSHFLKI